MFVDVEKRSRNKIDLLLDFLKFTYENSYEKADRSTICELAGKVDDLIYYQDIERAHLKLKTS